jgi:glycosyltransferase involved in cell wall biosynthesis
MKRQRVVLLIENSTGIGGSTVSLFRLVSRLREGPYQPLILFYRDNDYVPRFRELGVGTAFMTGDRGAARRTPVPSAGKRRKSIASLAKGYRRLFSRDIPEAIQIYELIKKKEVCLVHINGRFSSSRGAILAAKLARVPCLCHIRDFHSFDALDRWFARGVNAFLYISRAVQVHTERLLPSARGHLVYDGVDQAEFQAYISPTLERERLGLGRGDLVIGNIGRLVEWKGQHVFLEALSRIADEFPGLKALVAGDPDPPTEASYLERLKGLTRDLGLEARVTFTGFAADVPRFMATLDVLVHSSIRPEPFGLTILEGMAAGRPVVATAAGGVLDLIQEGETGRLVPLGDPYSMSEVLRQILSRREEAARMGEAARRQVAQRFTVEQFAEGVERAYSNVLP